MSGEEKITHGEVNYILPETKVYSFQSTYDPGGGYYEDRGHRIDKSMLQDPSAITIYAIGGTPDGRTHNVWLLLKARLMGNIYGDCAIRLNDLRFPDDNSYQAFRIKYQATTPWQLPHTLKEWGQRYPHENSNL